MDVYGDGRVFESFVNHIISYCFNICASCRIVQLMLFSTMSWSTGGFLRRASLQCLEQIVANTLLIV